MGICAFFYMWNLFGEVVFQRCMVYYQGGQWHSNKKERERGGPSALDMSIFWHGPSALDMSIFWHGPSVLDMSVFQHRLFSVVVIQRSMVNEWGVPLPLVYCILRYVKVIKCSVAEIYGQLRGVNLPWVYVHFLLLHRMLGMSIFLHRLYCKLIQCSGVPEIYGQLRGGTLWWVDVDSAMYETYLV